MNRFPVFLVFIAAGCGGDAPAPGPDARHVVLTPDLEIGRLDGDDAFLFARIAGLAHDAQGRIYVAETQASEVRAFAPDGAFLFRIGRQGGGPGEFDGLCCIAVDDDDRLWVRDGGNNRFTVFAVGEGAARVLHSFPMATASGNFWAATHFTEDGRLVQVGHRPGADVPEQVLLHTDTAGQVSDSLHIPPTPADSLGMRTIPYGDGGLRFLYPPYGALEMIAHGPDGTWAKAVSSAYRVAWYAEDGALLRVIEKPDVVGPALTEDERARAEERVIREAERFNLSASERSRVPDRKQPLASLFFDEAGRLWVQRSTRADEGNRADVYGADGALAFTAEWPADVELDLPGRIDEDVALGVAVDSLGVQRVVRMPLR